MFREKVATYLSLQLKQAHKCIFLRQVLHLDILKRGKPNSQKLPEHTLLKLGLLKLGFECRSFGF